MLIVFIAFMFAGGSIEGSRSDAAIVLVVSITILLLFSYGGSNEWILAEFFGLTSLVKAMC